MAKETVYRSDISGEESERVYCSDVPHTGNVECIIFSTLFSSDD